jgi:NSS family neurotransmitter:Na+ symporter
MSESHHAPVQWSSRLAFILAASGSAVGLGNLWKFPYLTGENGGGAFVLVYMACVALIGIPLMAAETLIGRRGRGSPVHAMRQLAHTHGFSRHWQLLGWGGMLASLLILSYYSVIAGWSMAYIFKMNNPMNSHPSPEMATAMFQGLLAEPKIQFIWHTLFMTITMLIVSRGVSQGLEKSSRALMPGLLIMLLVLVFYGMSTDSFGAAFSFMFKPDFSKLGSESLLIAMGQAFFSLGLGMGTIMVYGAYLPDNIRISHSIYFIAATDTGVALLAGLAIFPVVFENHLQPGMGPGLIFETLPLAFSHMPMGTTVGTLFFVLVFVAALTSSIALLEPVTAWSIERFGLERGSAAFYCASLAWLLGIGSMLSFSTWSDLRLLDRNFFETIDFITADLMLPLGGLMIAVFAGWRLPEALCRAELHAEDPGHAVFPYWWKLIRFVVPAAVLLILLSEMRGG